VVRAKSFNWVVLLAAVFACCSCVTTVRPSSSLPLRRYSRFERMKKLCYVSVHTGETRTVPYTLESYRIEYGDPLRKAILTGLGQVFQEVYPRDPNLSRRAPAPDSVLVVVDVPSFRVDLGVTIFDNDRASLVLHVEVLSPEGRTLLNTSVIGLSEQMLPGGATRRRGVTSLCEKVMKDAIDKLNEYFIINRNVIEPDKEAG